MPRAFRIITYELSEPAFTGNTFDLVLNQNLVPNYFTMIIGGAGGNTSRAAGDNFVGVTADPFGSGSLNISSGPRVLSLARNQSNGSWLGSVTVVECLGGFDTVGFRLRDVVKAGLSSSGTSVSVPVTNSWNDINQVIPFGGLRGGGVYSNQGTGGSSTNPSCHGSYTVQNSPSPQLTWTRDLSGAVGVSAESLTYIVEWGSDWNIQHVTVNGSSGGQNANSTAEYDTATINQVTRANTFVWGCGYTSDGGIGDSFSGTLVTLGDGVNQNATETTVAVGQEYSDTRTVDVYVAENPLLNVDYRFKSDGNGDDLDILITTDLPLGNENYPDSGGNFLHAGALAMPSIDGSDGGWPGFYGSQPLGVGVIGTVVIEDNISDTDLAHTQEEVSYLVFGGTSNNNIENSSGVVIGEYGVINSVGSSGVFLTFANAYTNPVVVVTPHINSGDNPVTARAYNVTSTGCTVRYDAASAGAPSVNNMYFVVLESGAHTLPGGIPCEAGILSNFSGWNRNTDWSLGQMQQVTPINSYDAPVVFGGVQTDNDSNFQGFWANGGSQTTSPTSSTIYVGRQIAEDTNNFRASEDLGYLIWESGEGLAQVGGRKWWAGYTDDIVEGLGNSPPYATTMNISGAGVLPTSGFRCIINYNTCSGTGNAYPRPYFGVRHISEGVAKLFRGYNGQPFASWLQSVDFYNLQYTVAAQRRVAVCS